MVSFSKISTIVPNKQETWEKKVFLTFDLDWAHDEVISDTIDLLDQSEVSSTWFVTHKSSVLEKLSKQENVELGIHPNFSIAFNQSNKINKKPEKVLNDLLDIVPDAKSVRSHSLFHSERLVDDFNEFGLSHISNCFIPYGSGLDIRPFSIWEDMVMVPHCWQDNVALRMNLPFPNKSELLKSHFVFNFHPIHIFLNTEKIERYESTRPFHQNPDKLISRRFNGVGTRTLLIDLLKVLKDREKSSMKTISL
jgi:hypothetical protein